jgi:dihydrofolate synthase / folylpolyglutamate synthase
MTYAETIDYLFSRLPLFSRIGAAAIRKDLTNTLALCNSLGDPQTKFRSIHIAGTNGKGSVSHMLAAIIQQAGYKTGLYTSPHLKDFRERIRINGVMIGEQEVIRFTEDHRAFIESQGPSFFEITVGMAFNWFAREKVDIAIIEAGLGGRLDSTNVILPELAVITNIGWDHMDMLGNELPIIAAEKAGIIKQSVPVIIGEYDKESFPVFEQKAKEKNASITVASKKRSANNWHWEKHELVIEVEDENKTDHAIYRLDLTGIYQRKNLLTVLETCSQLINLGWKIDENAVHSALRQVKKLTGLHGRWEQIHSSPAVFLDVAHNIDGIAQLIQQIEVTTHNNLHIIIGMVRDKEIEKILELLPKTARYYFTKAQIPRAYPEQDLFMKAGKAGLNGAHFPNVNAALLDALSHAKPDDLVVICGSVYLVAEVNKLSPSFSKA